MHPQPTTDLRAWQAFKAQEERAKAMRADPDFHEGQVIYRFSKTHALELCPAGHLVSSHDLKGWAGSSIEARWGQPKIVQCIGALRRRPEVPA
jgi:hypothetical protein